MSGLIPESFIQELLARTDIVDVIGARLELKRAGREYKACSPFTNEKTPSFFVSPAKQMYFDFSSGTSGSAIRFLMEYDRLSFPEAVAELAQRAGLQVPTDGRRDPAMVLDGPLDTLAAAARIYRAELKRSPKAVAYLKERGVSGETARIYGIGYAPGSWDFLSTQFTDPGHAVTAGLLRQKPGASRVYDVFRNRIMFPIRDTRGRIIGFGGRALDDDPAKYLNSGETPLFHKGRNLFGLFEARQAFRGAMRSVLVVEGYMDAVMLAQYGFPNVVATLGTATTTEHLTLLFKTASCIIFCFDGDRAGRAAAWRALELILPEIGGHRECRFMFLPDGQDPDTLVRQIGAKGFARQIDEALPLSEFLISELSRQVDLSTLDGRARLISIAQPYLARVREESLLAVLRDELVRLSRLTPEDVGRLVQRPKPQPSSRLNLTRVRHGEPGSRSVRTALRLLIEMPDLARRVTHLGQIVRAPLPGVQILVDALEFFIERPDGSMAQLMEFWHGSSRAAALQRLAAEPLALQPEGLVAEFDNAIRQLRCQALKSRLQTLLAGVKTEGISAACQHEIAEIRAELAEVEVSLRNSKLL